MTKKNIKKNKQNQINDSQLLADKKSNQPQGENNDSIVDEISEDFDRFETWVIANGKYILTACILLIVAVAIFFTVVQVRANSRKAGTLKLANAEKVEDLEKALKEVSASIPGYDVAQFRLAHQYAAAKKYDLAFAAYKAIAERKNDLYLSNRARLDSAYVKELSAKTAEAAAIFASVADDATVLADLRSEAAYGAGRLFLAQKNLAAAKKYLGQVDPMKATTPVAAQWAMLSQAQLNRLPKAAPAAPAKKVSAAKK